MQYATDYSACVDWAGEAAITRDYEIERRYLELVVELQNDRDALIEAWDRRCDELTGNEVAQYLRDNNLPGLFAAVKSIVKGGINAIAEERAEKEVGRG